MKQSIIVICLLFFYSYSYAQQDYDWIERGITITLPNDFDAPIMTAEEFKSSGNGMSYKIQVVEDQSIDERHISKFPVDIAAKAGLDVVSKIHRVEVHGFIAAYAQVSKGEESYYLLGMIDPDSHTHFYIMVSYDDFDEVEMEEALEFS